MTKMRIVTINLPEAYLQALKTCIDDGMFNSRSQGVRVCLTEFLEAELELYNDLNSNDFRGKKP